VHGKEENEEHAGHQAVGVEQAEQAPLVAELQIGEIVAHRNPFEDVAEGDTEEECRQEAGNDDRLVPGSFPAVVVDFTPELEGDAADDEGKEEQDQGRIEVTEHEGIGCRECGKRGAAGREEPDLVAIPDRTDRIDQDTFLRVSPGNETGEETCAENKAVEHEIDSPQYAPENKPGDLEN